LLKIVEEHTISAPYMCEGTTGMARHYRKIVRHVYSEAISGSYYYYCNGINIFQTTCKALTQFLEGGVLIAVLRKGDGKVNFNRCCLAAKTLG
jgi:hypothetical protein